MKSSLAQDFTDMEMPSLTDSSFAYASGGMSSVLESWSLDGFTGNTQAKAIAPGPTSAHTPRQEQLLADLELYGRLEDGWDGEDALAPSTDALAAIRMVAGRLPAGIAAPSASINADGEIALYWDDDRIFLELTAEVSGRMYLFLRDKDSGRCSSNPDWTFSEAGSAQLFSGFVAATI